MLSDLKWSIEDRKDVFVDDLILDLCELGSLTLVTLDVNMRVKARARGITIGDIGT